MHVTTVKARFELIQGGREKFGLTSEYTKCEQESPQPDPDFEIGLGGQVQVQLPENVPAIALQGTVAGHLSTAWRPWIRASAL